ncbi:MAG: hypothetical protein NUV80_05860 [Candidatus Berkelbacteria bacterium]|nr:hypothetical protein [Candidatus Berkelbacteria bacterium]MCR4308059.1 hypothetical protein [Candidatus Berkelbacteria bacterium]
MHLTIWQHLSLAWGAFALLAFFTLRYGTGKRTHPYFCQGLLIGHLLTAGLANWPLLVTPIWCLTTVAPLVMVAIGLLMIGVGSILERAGKEAQVPSDVGGVIVGYGGAIAIGGLLFSLLLLTFAASFIGAATFFI